MATSRRLPKQQRSRERVERMLGATAELIAEGGIDALTMAGVAERSDVAIATVYRYFADRDELAAEFFDGEMERINLTVAEALFALEKISIRSVVETAMFAHLRHHQANPETAKAWFQSPRAKVVHEHVKRQDERMGTWLREVLAAANMLDENAPPIGEVLLVELGDRTFEWIFRQELSEREQDEAISRFVDMVASYLERFATPAGRDGISSEVFVAALGTIAQETDADPTRQMAVGGGRSLER
jgi:AcrR family transcriptional regulator